MKWSKYNYLFKSKIGKNLIYNSLSNSFLELDEETYTFLSANISFPDVLLNSEHSELFIKHKILVGDDNDEILELSFLDILARTNNKILSLTIAPTYDCNFDCIYCYENERRIVYMSDDTVSHLLEFIGSYKDVALSITWYGGEPLMAVKQIRKICEGLKKLKIPVSHFIVTNGYLINDNVINLFTEYQINNAQITIDGPSDIHDKRRFLKGDKPTFAKILSNIDELLCRIPNFSIDFRVNIDRRNENSFGDIYNTLKERYPKNNIRVYAGFVDEVGVCDNKSHCIFDRMQVVNFKKKTFEKMGIDLGIYPDFGRYNCVAKALNGYVIGADGFIFKCWNDVGISEKAISSLTSPKISNRKVLFRYLNANDNIHDPHCLECILLPVCNGGCQYQRVANAFDKKNIDTCHMAKDNLKELLELYYEKKCNCCE